MTSADSGQGVILTCSALEASVSRMPVARQSCSGNENGVLLYKRTPSSETIISGYIIRILFEERNSLNGIFLHSGFVDIHTDTWFVRNLNKAVLNPVAFIKGHYFLIHGIGMEI